LINIQINFCYAIFKNKSFSNSKLALPLFILARERFGCGEFEQKELCLVFDWKNQTKRIA